MVFISTFMVMDRNVSHVKIGRKWVEIADYFKRFIGKEIKAALNQHTGRVITHEQAAKYEENAKQNDIFERVDVEAYQLCKKWVAE